MTFWAVQFSDNLRDLDHDHLLHLLLYLLLLLLLLLLFVLLLLLHLVVLFLLVAILLLLLLVVLMLPLLQHHLLVLARIWVLFDFNLFFILFFDDLGLHFLRVVLDRLQFLHSMRALNEDVVIKLNWLQPEQYFAVE